MDGGRGSLPRLTPVVRMVFGWTSWKWKMAELFTSMAGKEMEDIER
jgi:hypothetical protein